MLTLSVTEARARLREALERVKDGEEIKLSQNGQVVAVLVHPDKLRARVRTPNTLAAEDRLEALRALRGAPLKRPRQGLSPERAEALVQALHEDRDGDWG